MDDPHNNNSSAYSSLANSNGDVRSEAEGHRMQETSAEEIRHVHLNFPPKIFEFLKERVKDRYTCVT